MSASSQSNETTSRYRKLVKESDAEFSTEIWRSKVFPGMAPDFDWTRGSQLPKPSGVIGGHLPPRSASVDHISRVGESGTSTCRELNQSDKLEEDRDAAKPSRSSNPKITVPAVDDCPVTEDDDGTTLPSLSKVQSAPAPVQSEPSSLDVNTAAEARERARARFAQVAQLVEDREGLIARMAVLEASEAPRTTPGHCQPCRSGTYLQPRNHRDLSSKWR